LIVFKYHGTKVPWGDKAQLTLFARVLKLLLFLTLCQDAGANAHKIPYNSSVERIVHFFLSNLRLDNPNGTFVPGQRFSTPLGSLLHESVGLWLRFNP